MRTIALIEDDRDIQELLRYRLQREGYRLAVHSSGREAIPFLLRNRPSLILLDVMLPHVQGWEICKMARANPQLAAVPIIFLSARGSEGDRVMGLEMGGNDYLVKPFFVRELIARIKLHILPEQMTEPVVALGGLELDRERFELKRMGESVPLTATEFKLLSFLMSRPGRVCARSELIHEVWGTDRDVAERAVDVAVLRLRQKLQDQPENPKWIHSIRGFGYAFDPNRAAS
ncbi:MAG: response regulator transcription factor [Bryobacterales bacterium]|nr:response regulator transcription factor [Acidobacteriota bacterium]MCB9383987.1 response regulator transcription factor [Bryobacterales bacterium]